MNLNARFTKCAVMHLLDWKASSMPGVGRRMLDRMGDEVAHHSIVHHQRQAAIQRFQPSLNSMTCSLSCARSKPALELFVRSLSIRRSAASTRSRARFRSASVYCLGSGRVRFLRPFDALLARKAALSRFAVAIGPLRFSERIPPIKHIWRGFASRVAVILGVWSRADHRSSFLRAEREA